MLLSAANMLTFVGVAAVGVLVAWRQPDNPFGWLLSASGLMIGWLTFASGYALFAARAGPVPVLGDGTTAAWLAAVFAPLNLGLAGLALLLLPNGVP